MQQACNSSALVQRKICALILFVMLLSSRGTCAVTSDRHPSPHPSTDVFQSSPGNRPKRYSDYIKAEPIIFETESTSEEVILWGKDVPGLDYITIHVNYGPPCSHGGQRWKNMSSYNRTTHQCLFGIGVNQVATKVHSLTQQTFRCGHPPTELRQSLIGKPVTMTSGDYVMPTICSYKPVAPEPPTKKKYTLCSCMTMWYRSEFLLEWLHYHSFVHGLEKVFVYDNGSEIDYLASIVDMLNALLPVERIDWPYHPTQLAYMGHCVFKAAKECSWVMFTDVDEFFYGKKNDGRLDTILINWKNVAPYVGGIEVQMLAMGPQNASAVIRKPVGGVVRNYQCIWKATNIKTIIRPETVHPSLFGGVHFFCYNSGYIKKTLKSFHNPVIYHYKMQAWEIHMRKYTRRASPASKPFIYTNISVDVPSQRWWDEIDYCRRSEPIMARHVLCALSEKVLTNCSSNSTAHLLVAGTGGYGSGMGWMWKQLTTLLRGSELLISVDWTRGLLRPRTSSLNPNPSMRFTHVFHQVREPLEAIRASTTISDNDWEALRLVSNFDAKLYMNPIRRGLHYWVIWNQLLETISDWSFQVEHIDFSDICLRAKLLPNCNNSEFPVHRYFAEDASVAKLSWVDLAAADRNITLIAWNMAKRYGYIYDDFDLDANSNKMIL